MNNILVICPTHRDLRELENPSAKSHYNFLFYGDDASEHLEKFNALKFIDETLAKFKGKDINGVISTDDYPGCIIASVMAKKFDLPTPETNKIILFQHKYYSRQAQLNCVPEAVPKFALVDPFLFDLEKVNKNNGIEFPFFIKPVKSFFSVMASKVNNHNELKEILKIGRTHCSVFVRPFNQLLEKYTSFELSANYLLAEQLLEGIQVTIEGFVYKNKVEIMGIIDSIMYPGTISFKRFEYPSKLSREVQEKMEKIATKLVSTIGFDNGIFNMEMFYNPKTNAIHIIEVNPRMCSQFADINEKIHGANTYEIQLALSLGKKPKFEKNMGKYRNAASFVFRTFKDGTVIKTPEQKEIERLKEHFPDVRLEIFVNKGMKLSDTLQDGKSYRYGIVNIGGKNEQDLFQRFEECKKYIKFEIS